MSTMAILKCILLVTALIMTLFILIQDGKGAVAIESTSAPVSGVVNPIRRATWMFAGFYLLLASAIAYLD